MGERDIDPQRQAKAKEYARIRRRLLLVDLGLGGALLLAMLFGGISLWLKGRVLALTANQWGVVALYFLLFCLGYGLLLAPLSYYSGYLLPRRYGLLTQDLKGWLKDQAKGGAIGLSLGLVVIELVYYLLRRFSEAWWLFAGGFLLLLSVVLSSLAPVLFLPLFFKFTPLEDMELARRLEELAERAGTSVQGVYTIDMSRRTTMANAALMGLGKTRRIVLGDTLYENYDADEIETILAHELGHHLHRDLWWSIGVQTVLTVGGLYLAHLALSWGVEKESFSGPSDIAAFPLFGMAMGVFMLVTMPLGNAFSRWRETLADGYALRATGKAEAFISVMAKLANQNLADAEPEPWVEFLLYSHPAIIKRMERAREFGALEG